MNKVVGWVFIVVGGVVVLIGVLALLGDETGSSMKLFGIGGVLAFAGWAIRRARGSKRSGGGDSSSYLYGASGSDDSNDCGSDHGGDSSGDCGGDGGGGGE